MAFNYKVLFQAQLANTTANNVYQPGASIRSLIKYLAVHNTHTSNVTITIYLDSDGTTYNATTQIHKVTLAPDETFNLDVNIGMDGADSGSIGVQASVANVVNVLGAGAEAS